MSDTSTGGVPARRAVTRWAWRLLRRDWRQHLLIVLLLSVAVAAAVGFACAAFNAAPTSGRAEFGDADHSLRFNDRDPAMLQPKVDEAAAHFGAIDAIGHRPVPVPGTVRQVDYRSQQPDGPFGSPLLDLLSGRYPATVDEAAVTDWLADTLDARSARRSIWTARRAPSWASSRTPATSMTSSSSCRSRASPTQTS